MDDLNVFEGMRVRFINADKHESRPDFFPPMGSIGTVLSVDDVDDPDDLDAAGEVVHVEWPEGSTSEDDCWWCAPEDIEPVGDAQRGGAV